MDQWNGFDFFVFLIFAVNTLLGMSRAAAKEIISMMCLCVALVCTIKFTIPLATLLNKSPLIVDAIGSKYVQNFMTAIGLPPLNENTIYQLFYCVAFLICFVGVFSICEAVLAASGILEVYSFPYAWLNRKLGAVLGGIRGYVLTLILISLTVLHLFKDSDNSMFTKSMFVKLFYTSAERLDSIVSGQKPEQYQNIFKDKYLFNPLNALQELSKPALKDVVPSNMITPQTQPSEKPQ